MHTIKFKTCKSHCIDNYSRRYVAQIYMWNATQDADVLSSLEFDKDARHVECEPTQFSNFRRPNSKNVIFT